MGKLVKGMYGSQFENKSTLFGLRCGQLRGGLDKFTHNSGWYNKSGEKLGWGDLSVRDIRRISCEIPNGELFIILGERDSFWEFVTFNRGSVGSLCATDPRMEAPGVEYIAEKCRYIIAEGYLYYVDECVPQSHRVMLTGLTIKALTRAEASELIRDKHQRPRRRKR